MPVEMQKFIQVIQPIFSDVHFNQVRFDSDEIEGELIRMCMNLLEKKNVCELDIILKSTPGEVEKWV